MIIRGAFNDFYLADMLPAIKALTDAKYKAYPETFPKIFNVDGSSRSIEQFSSISGVGLASLLGEGEPVRTDEPVQGFDSTFVHTKHGLSIPISKETVSDDKFGLIKKMLASLVRSVKETREYRAASHFNNGFDTGFAGPDGKPLFSTTHPLVKSGGVQSNALAVAADLDVSSAQLALTAFMTMKDSAGIFHHVPAKNLVYHPTNHFNAMEILKSSNRSDTANHTVNALSFAQDGILNPLVWRHLSDEDAWFITGAPDDTGLIWLDREKPHKSRYYDELSEVMYEIMRYRASSGWNDFYGTFGTPGA